VKLNKSQSKIPKSEIRPARADAGRQDRGEHSLTEDGNAQKSILGPKASPSGEAAAPRSASPIGRSIIGRSINRNASGEGRRSKQILRPSPCLLPKGEGDFSPFPTLRARRGEECCSYRHIHGEDSLSPKKMVRTLSGSVPHHN